MELVHQSAVVISDPNPYKKVEMAGRTCYKSPSDGTEEGAVKFTKRLIKSGHTAMLEHAVFCFEIYPVWKEDLLHPYIVQLCSEKFFNVTYRDGRMLVSANVRAICGRNYRDPVYHALAGAYPDIVWEHQQQKEWSSELPFKATIIDLERLDGLSMSEIAAHKHMTFRFVTNRGCSHEIVRHRPCSFAQESTRYVNYQDGLKIIYPADWDKWTEERKRSFVKAWEASEKYYGELIEAGCRPQEARAVLPIGLKTEIVVTANLKEWAWIFDLRLFGTTGAPHPDIKHLMSLAFKEACKDSMIRTYFETMRLFQNQANGEE